jgi:hypothetical protein
MLFAIFRLIHPFILAGISPVSAEQAGFARGGGVGVTQLLAVGVDVYVEWKINLLRPNKNSLREKPSSSSPANFGTTSWVKATKS